MSYVSLSGTLAPKTYDLAGSPGTLASWNELQTILAQGRNSGYVVPNANHFYYAFRLAVKAGFVPLSLDGWNLFNAWYGTGGINRRATGDPNILAFDQLLAEWLARAAQVQPAIDAYLKSQGGNPAALPDAPWFADTYLGLAAGTPPVAVAAPVAPVVGPRTDMPNGIQFGADTNLWSGSEGIARLTMMRAATPLSNGQLQTGAWTPVGPWLVRYTSNDVGPRPFEGWWGIAIAGVNAQGGVPAPGPALPGPSEWTALLTQGEGEARRFLAQSPAIKPPAIWGTPFASWIKGAGPQVSIPYVPGSTVLVPVPGSGEIPKIQLPGTKDWIDVTAVPPGTNQNVPQNAPPPVVVSTTPNGGQVVETLQPTGDGGGVVPSSGVGGEGSSNNKTVLYLGLAALAFLVFGRRRRG